MSQVSVGKRGGGKEVNSQAIYFQFWTILQQKPSQRIFFAIGCLGFVLCSLIAGPILSYLPKYAALHEFVSSSSSSTSAKKQRSPAVWEELYRCIESASDNGSAWPIAEWTYKQNDVKPLSTTTIAIPSGRKGEYCWKAGHEFTWDDAIARLEGKHLVLFGDSLTRYQYLSLVFFLVYKKWPDVPFCDQSEVCSSIWPKDMNHEFCHGDGVKELRLTRFLKLTSKYLRRYERLECK